MPPLDRSALGIVAASVPLRVALCVSTRLTPDEAYYLSAARLGETIPDHPPATVWILKIADALLLPGSLELRVRLPTLLLGIIAALLIVDIIRLRGGNAPCQRWGALLSSWLLLPLAGGFLATPDALTFVATAALVRAEDQRSPKAAAVWAAASVAAGMLSKVIVGPVAAAFLIASSRGRSHKLAIAAGLALALPLSLRSLAFQTHHAFGTEAWSLANAGTALGAAFLGQLALWTPILAVIGVRELLKAKRVDQMVAGVLALLFLASAACRAVPPEPNWLAPGWSVVLVAAAFALPRASRTTQFTLVTLGPLLALVAATHAIHPWIPIPQSVDPSARLHFSSTDGTQRSLPGVGSYGLPAERCVYEFNCGDILEYFQRLR